jgi:cyanophycinase
MTDNLTIIQKNDRVKILELEGPLDANTEQTFFDTARQVKDSGARFLLINLSGVNIITSAGLRALHNGFKLFLPQDEMEAWQKENPGAIFKSPYFKLACAPTHVYYVLSLAGFIHNIPIFANIEDALKSFDSVGMGYLLLEGGAEFGGQMSEPDLRAIELAGGFDVPIRILPTAAAPDNNHRRAGQNGVQWFKKLGAGDVEAVDVIDPATANDPNLAASIRTSKLIYILGGFPRHLEETLANSLAWRAVLEAYQGGAVVAGSSAGAMVLCQHYYDPYEEKVLEGLNLIGHSCVLPHHNNFGKAWANHLAESLPDSVLIGIDEGTGMVSGPGGKWTVSGAGAVTLYRHGAQTSVHARGGQFAL